MYNVVDTKSFYRWWLCHNVLSHLRVSAFSLPIPFNYLSQIQRFRSKTTRYSSFTCPPKVLKKNLRYKIGSFNKSVSYRSDWLYNDQLPTLSLRMWMICSMSFLSIVRKLNKVQLIWGRRRFIGRTTDTCIQFQKLLKSIPCICYDQENRLTWGHIKMSHNLR